MRIFVVFLSGYLWYMASGQSKPDDFFRLLRNNKEIDLVLMIDRTFAMGRDNFYLVAMNLAYDIIRHHVWVQDNRVRLAIVTFANDTNIIMNAISDEPPPRLFSFKCSLFYDGSDDETFYWPKLHYNETKDCEFPEYSRIIAYNKANQLLYTGRIERPSVVQIVLMITVPVCVDDVTTILDAKKPLEDNNVHIFPIELTYGATPDVRESPQWMKAVRDQPPLLNYTTFEISPKIPKVRCAGDEGICDTRTGFVHCNDDLSDLKDCADSPCENGGTCYEDKTNQYAVCFCPWGYTGRYCETTKNMCSMIEDACVTSNECMRGTNSYTCRNDNYQDTNPHNCTIIRENCKEKEKDVLKWIIVGIPVGICALIIFGASVYACYAICCAKDKVERRRKVVSRVRDSVHAVRQSMVALGRPPELPPKQSSTNRTQPRYTEHEPHRPNRPAPVQPAPRKIPNIVVIPEKPKPPVPPPKLHPILDMHTTVPRNYVPESKVPETPPIPADRPPAVVQLATLMKTKRDKRESSTDYIEPTESENPEGPYGSEGYDAAVEVDDDFDEDYEGEFDDFYDYAWKTGNLQTSDHRYLHLINEPPMHTLPRAPETRPDIVLDAEHSRQNRPVASDGYGWAPLQSGMLAWQNYVCDLTDSHDGMDLDRVCIMQTDSKRWIASDNSLRPTEEQMRELWHAFHVKLRNGGQIKLGSFKERTFAINENDGITLKAIGGKDGKRDEALCATRTKQFVVLAGLVAERDRGQLEREVAYIREHLLTSGQ